MSITTVLTHLKLKLTQIEECPLSHEYSTDMTYRIIINKRHKVFNSLQSALAYLHKHPKRT